MLLLDAQKNIIIRCDSSPDGIRIPGMTIRNQHKPLINTELLKDDSFYALFDRWIKPCIELMDDYREIDSKIILALFYNDNEPNKQKLLLEHFKKFIRGNKPYKEVIWYDCSCDNICNDIENLLTGTKEYIKLRVKIISLFLGVHPEEIFQEGKNWFQTFQYAASDDQCYIEVNSSHNTFNMDFSRIGKLTPKYLYNKSSRICPVHIRYQKKTFDISIPPKFSLKVLFGNEDCTNLVGIKGSISVNSMDARNAVAMINKNQKSSLYMLNGRFSEPFCCNINGVFFDAAADGDVSFVLLRKDGMEYPGQAPRFEKRETPPVRVYCAGDVWVFQYEDGSLESNITRGGLPVTSAYSVVENSNTSLMYLDKDGAWEYFGGRSKRISQDTFVQAMLERFQHDDVYEQVEAFSQKLNIKRDGTLEVV